MPAARRPEETEEQFQERKRGYRRDTEKRRRQRLGLSAPHPQRKNLNLPKEDYQKQYRQLFGRPDRPIYNKRVKLLKREIIDSFKSPCKCGESDPIALDFHHRNPEEKEFNIGQALTRRVSLVKLLEEVAKCDVMCANCHRKLHRDQKIKLSP